MPARTIAAQGRCSADPRSRPEAIAGSTGARPELFTWKGRMSRPIIISAWPRPRGLQKRSCATSFVFGKRCGRAARGASTSTSGSRRTATSMPQPTSRQSAFTDCRSSSTRAGARARAPATFSAAMLRSASTVPVEVPIYIGGFGRWLRYGDHRFDNWYTGAVSGRNFSWKEASCAPPQPA